VKHALLIGILICALAVPALAADAPDCAARPAWCQSGFVCQPTACAAEASAQLRLLTAMLEDALKGKPGHWRRFAGCGGGPTWIVHLDDKGRFGVESIPLAPACIGGFGYTW